MESQRFVDAHDYFGEAIALYGRFDVTQALAKGQIIPSDSTKYIARDFRTAINSSFGFLPALGCANDAHGIQTIQEIYLCFAGNNLSKVTYCL